MTARLRYRSPVGLLLVEATEEGVVGLSFGAGGPSRTGVSALARGHVEAARAALDAYFAGKPPVLPTLALRGSPFQQAVWAALTKIPWAEVRTSPKGIPVRARQTESWKGLPRRSRAGSWGAWPAK